MRYTKLGKPLCIGQNAQGHACRRVGVYVFHYRSHGRPAQAYYCAACAKSRNYTIFRQPLLYVGAQLPRRV